MRLHFRTLILMYVTLEVTREATGVPVAYHKMQLGLFFGGQADEAQFSICLSFEECVVQAVPNQLT